MLSLYTEPELVIFGVLAFDQILITARLKNTPRLLITEK